MKDELERAYKEREEALKEQRKLEENMEETRKLLLGKLDLIFSDFSKNIQTQSRWFIDKLISTNAIAYLEGLRDECNLIYAQEKVFHTQKDLSLTTATRTVPAKLELSGLTVTNNYRRKWQKKRSVVDKLPYPLSKVIMDCSLIDYPIIEISPTVNLYSTLSDYKIWHSYYCWSDTIKNLVITNEFLKIEKDFDTAVKFLEFPPLDYVCVQLTWNYEYHTGSEIGDEWESFERIMVRISANTIEVSRKNGFIASISVASCTPNWIKQQIANAYVNYG